MNGIERIVINISSDFAVMDGKLSLEDELINIGIYPLKLWDLIVALGDEFHIQFSDSDLDKTKLTTLADVSVLMTAALVKQGF